MTFGERAAILAHIGWGAALTFGSALWLGTPAAIGAAFAVATVKESIESIWGAWDTKQPWSGAVKDVAEFGAGIAAAAISLFIRHGGK